MAILPGILSLTSGYRPWPYRRLPADVLNIGRQDSRCYSTRRSHSSSSLCFFGLFGAIGKTSLLISYASGGFPRDYHAHQMYQGKAFNLGLWDTAGQEDFDRLRPLGYSNTDVYLICFSVVNPPSYSNVCDKWLQEINHYNTTKTPIVLVGTQIDLRSDQQTLDVLAQKQQQPITYEEGLMMKKKIGAASFAECSVQTMKGVKQVFEEAIRVYIDSQMEKNGSSRKKKKRSSTSKNNQLQHISSSSSSSSSQNHSVNTASSKTTITSISSSSNSNSSSSHHTSPSNCILL
ncbi:Rho GTPase [Cavenderia fasciculata]|uniref:Rho GTPase n=1 Tax=Cavenderia fasciculata TaxID=261658 RepID=F4PR91_CACFS|nr:Rho GTPase [Cavenderia fasciculata]EGG21291.1 Rho GTPase [Cavenderia fasciculata]|eukprot:XP_004359141.1 Rho GTPase [Cavenderia fasciculata]